MILTNKTRFINPLVRHYLKVIDFFSGSMQVFASAKTVLFIVLISLACASCSLLLSNRSASFAHHPLIYNIMAGHDAAYKHSLSARPFSQQEETIIQQALYVFYLLFFSTLFLLLLVLVRHSPAVNRSSIVQFQLP